MKVCVRRKHSKHVQVRSGQVGGHWVRHPQPTFGLVGCDSCVICGGAERLGPTSGSKQPASGGRRERGDRYINLRSGSEMLAMLCLVHNLVPLC